LVVIVRRTSADDDPVVAVDRLPHKALDIAQIVLFVGGPWLYRPSTLDASGTNQIVIANGQQLLAAGGRGGVDKLPPFGVDAVDAAVDDGDVGEVRDIVVLRPRTRRRGGSIGRRVDERRADGVVDAVALVEQRDPRPRPRQRRHCGDIVRPRLVRGARQDPLQSDHRREPRVGAPHDHDVLALRRCRQFGDRCFSRGSAGWLRRERAGGGKQRAEQPQGEERPGGSPAHPISGKILFTEA
jgi:hypothetical protein